MEERFLRTGAVAPERERRVHPFLTMVAKGLLRLALVVAFASTIAVALGLLIAWIRGDDLQTAIAYGFYLAGLLLFLATLLGGGRRVVYGIDTGEGPRALGWTINEGALLLFVAFYLLAMGAVVESQL